MKKQKNIISTTRSRFILLLIIIFLPYFGGVGRGFSQPIQQWVRYYSEQNIFTGAAGPLVLDDSGFVYITGSVNNVPPNGNNGFCTIKYSPSGTQQWVANYFSNNTGGRGGIAIA